MPPKAEITKEKIMGAAFEIAREEGFEALTARNIAQKLNCSTQPIYSAYGNMEELKDDTYEMVLDFTLAYIKKYENVKNEPAMNLAIGCLLFAKDEKKLYRWVFMTENKNFFLKKNANKLRDILYESLLQTDHRMHSWDESKRERLFLKLSIYVVGIGTMININTLELDIGEAEAMIEEMYQSLLNNEG